METLSDKLQTRAYRELPVSSIRVNENDLREEFDEVSLDQMGATMSEIGTFQPIAVSYDSKSDQHSLIIGGRRLRAAKRAKLETIPAYVMDDVKEQDALVMMLIENMQRSDLSPLEEARGMAELQRRFHFSEEKTASTLGKRPAFVRERLALLDLPDPIKEHLTKGRISVGAAISIALSGESEKTKMSIAEAAIEQGLSGTVVKRVVAELLSRKNERDQQPLHPRPTTEKRRAQLSAEEMRAALQRITLQGERLLNALREIQPHRWDEDGKKNLREAAQAIEEGLKQFRERQLR